MFDECAGRIETPTGAQVTGRTPHVVDEYVTTSEVHFAKFAVGKLAEDGSGHTGQTGRTNWVMEGVGARVKYRRDRISER